MTSLFRIPRRALTALAMVGGIAGSLLTMAPEAQATLQLGTGLIGGSGGLSNVIFSACGLGASSGFTVQGCLNDNHSTLVDFTSSEQLLIGEGGGQATITGAGDGNFTDFKINLDDPTLGFSTLQFAVDSFNDGSITFQAKDQFGTNFNLGTFALSGDGLNKFTLFSLDNEVAVSLSGVSTVGIDNISDLEQVRLGPTTIGVPEPSSLAILGGSLLALGFLRRRRRHT